MGVKFCPECGAQNDESTRFCTECGNRFPEAPEAVTSSAADMQPDRPSVAAEVQPVPIQGKDRKGKKTGLIICLVILALLLAAAAALFFTGTFDKISSTSKAGRGDYAGALESYEKYLSRSGDKSSEAYTRAALMALSAEDPDKALLYARSVPEQSEESERIARTAQVVMARQSAQQGKWKDALEMLGDMDSQEAVELRDECNYHLAEKALERGDYDDAVAWLENNAYPDAAALLEESRYRYGVELMEEEKWEEAIAQFDQTSYADSDDLRGQCYFHSSADYQFLSKMEEACYVVMDTETATDGLRQALEILNGCDLDTMHDSELAFFAEEYIAALQKELDLREKYVSDENDLYAHEYQQQLYAIYATESEYLEAVNELYPFPDDTWSELHEFNETPEYWNEYIAVSRQIAGDIQAIEQSTYVSDSEQYIEVPDNTAHDVEAELYFNFYDGNGAYIDYVSKTVSLKAGELTRVDFTVPQNAQTWDCEIWISALNS